MVPLLLHLLACDPFSETGGADTGDTAGDTADTDTGGDTSDTGDTGDTGDTADTDTGGDTGDTDTGDTADTGDSGDTDTGSDPCGGAATVPVTVAHVAYTTISPSAPRSLTATETSPGTFDVVDEHVADGCCPTPVVTAELTCATGLVDATYDLTADPCDCYTGLTLTYTLELVPDLANKLRARGLEVTL